MPARCSSATWTAQVAGDYAIGSNHVLPTAGAARYRGGLNAADFVKLVSVQRVTKRGLQSIAKTITTLARAEGLEAHARSIEVTNVCRTATDDDAFKAFRISGPGLRLHLNENTGGCSQKVVDAVRAFDGPALATYPDFRDAILETAAFLGVDPDRIVLTNGLDEGILLASIAYLGHRTPEALVELGAPLTTMSGAAEVLVAQPAFEPYLHGAHSLGARVVSVPPGKDFAFPLDGMLRAITPNTRIVYVNNPNNPSGQPIPKDAIHRIARRPATRWCSSTRRITIFSARTSSTEAADYPNVLVGRTFSKAFGLAGHARRRDDRVAGDPRADPHAACRCSTSTSSPSRRCARRLAIRRSARGTSRRPTNRKQLVYAACERAGLQVLEERRELRADRRRRARARDHRRHDREGRVRPRSHEGSGHADLLPADHRRRRTHAHGRRDAGGLVRRLR